MPEVTLSSLSLILGVICVAKGVWGIACSDKSIEFVKAFPRNDNAGYVTILAAMAWFLLILKGESMSDFERYRIHFNGFILITGIGACIYLKDYLAVRGSAVLMILLAKLIVDTARWHESDWRLVLVTLAYIMVVTGMWFTASPWRMRDLIQWATAEEGRFKKLCIGRVAFGILLVVLGLVIF
tara:strand:- start:466 stop:1014 length:549 start_codon:yes stop_codon:yes gene_type:complete